MQQYENSGECFEDVSELPKTRPSIPLKSQRVLLHVVTGPKIGDSSRTNTYILVCMITCGCKNGHQKGMSSIEIGLRILNALTVLQLNIQHSW